MTFAIDLYYSIKPIKISTYQISWVGLVHVGDWLVDFSDTYPTRRVDQNGGITCELELQLEEGGGGGKTKCFPLFGIEQQYIRLTIINH